MSAKWAKGSSGPAGDETANLVPACGVDVYNGLETGDTAATLGANTGQSASHAGPAVMLLDRETTHTLTAVAARGVTETGEGRGVPIVPTAPSGVRRLTPRECERLQGFPDDWTLVPHRGKPAADAPRYRALGNSMAVPVMRWIGERLDFVDRALIGRNANVS